MMINRKNNASRLSLALALVLAVGVTANAQQAAPNADQNQAVTTANPGVISSHQIDRYDALMKVRESLKENPNNLADWIILGELSQEIASEVEANRAEGYYRLARESYENALKLDPDNKGLQAAAEFAKAQEQNADQFNQTRQQATDVYLNAHRRELNEGEKTPSVRVYSMPNAAPTPAQPGVAQNEGTAPVQAMRNRPPYLYGYPFYQPYTNPEGQPYTYDQYNRSYFPPGYNQPNAAPTTLREYTRQFPQVLRNEAMRGVQRAVQGAEVNPAAAATPPTQP